MRKIIVTAEIWKEGNMFTAYCPELDVASCGHSSDEAKKNLSEVIEIQLEEISKLDTSMQIGIVLSNLDNSRL